MQQVGDLLNPKANHKLHTTAHSIETLHMHLDVCELNKDFIKGLHAGFAKSKGLHAGFDQINPRSSRTRLVFTSYFIKHGVVHNAWSSSLSNLYTQF